MAAVKEEVLGEPNPEESFSRRSSTHCRPLQDGSSRSSNR